LRRQTIKRSRFSKEHIIVVLKGHQAGLDAKGLRRKHGGSDATFYEWRSKFGSMEVSNSNTLRRSLLPPKVGRQADLRRYRTQVRLYFGKVERLASEICDRHHHQEA
jgi:hypothetical protein